MPTKEKEIDVIIKGGPNEMQLMFSLMRPHDAPYGIDPLKATSVHFTTNLQTPGVSGFSACIESIAREDGSGSSWCLEGYVFDKPLGFARFRGWYTSKTRGGVFTLFN